MPRDGNGRIQYGNDTYATRLCALHQSLHALHVHTEARPINTKPSGRSLAEYHWYGIALHVTSLGHALNGKVKHTSLLGTGQPQSVLNTPGTGCNKRGLGIVQLRFVTETAWEKRPTIVFSINHYHGLEFKVLDGGRGHNSLVCNTACVHMLKHKYKAD